MRIKETYKITNINDFKVRLLNWGRKFNHFIFLDSNRESIDNSNAGKYETYDCIAAAGNTRFISDTGFTKLKEFCKAHKDWIFGYLSYDMKNYSEDISSKNPDYISAADMYFFIPEFVFHINGKVLTIESHNETVNLFNEIVKEKALAGTIVACSPMQRFSKEEYCSIVCKILDHIKKGNIYEMNLCMEFFAEAINADPVTLFENLCRISPAPFSCYMHIDDVHLICASPERFLKKTGNRIISQPIKGTIKRGANVSDDRMLINQLYTDPKERSENIIITDLVRNDLSRTARKGSVKVEELCGIYSFAQVHQMISTIVSELSPQHHYIECIEAAFPMGSMTGTPKLRSMELIEHFERTRRGIYSGSVGYISPEEDFDFNVVIRSILYNTKNMYLSFQAGGAITGKSDPLREYEECLLKARAMIEAIS
ncbi:MAG: anthranilate synthase component I family protein [Bacteroidota bacterium]